MRACHLLVSSILFISAPGLAQSAFDGEWKADPSAAKFDPKPDVFSIRGGTYRCDSCVPAYAIPADGGFHAIAGQPYADETSLTVVNPSTTIERDRKGGKLMGESTSTVSPDGNTLTIAFKDYSAPNGTVVTGQEIETRVAPASAGAHATSGSWRQTAVSGVSDAGLRFTVATHGNSYRYSDPSGVSFEGVFGGPYVPLANDPARTMAKIERLGPTSIRETQMRDGKVVGIATITVSADGRTLTNDYHDVVHDTTNHLIAVKVQ